MAAGKKGKKGTLPFYNECNVENITLIFILPKKTGTSVIPRLRQQGEETLFHENYILH
ncbi:MAG: hypothetical protein ACJAV1_003409 [Paraglaciecola sp.]|jgi:hypothetical protein